MELKFKVRKETDKRMAVTYACDCGCSPSAEVIQGSDEAGHEHCCCGKVHFAGHDAARQLKDYLADRKALGEDEGLVYEIKGDSVKAPWGEVVAVAYALPSVEGEQYNAKAGHGHEHEHNHEHGHAEAHAESHETHGDDHGHSHGRGAH